MPSSTSNSSLRAKHYLANQKWRFTGLLILLFILFVIGIWESFWRFQGFIPAINDDWTVWSDIRRRANDNSNGVALVGASRIMLGLDPEILHQDINASVYMLAIDGSNPMPILEDLARDLSFKGSVIYSIVPYWLAGSGAPESDRTLKWLRKYHKQSLSSRIETKLAMFLQSHLAFRSSSLAPDKLWQKWKRGGQIVPPYAPIRPDRFREADYTKTNLVSLRSTREELTRKSHDNLKPLNQQEFLQRIKVIQSWVDQIQNRGGEVVFLRFPSCGLINDIEKRTIPRAAYWDVFARQISAPAFHFEDYQELQQFQCTDGSHLQYRDAINFTHKFAALLKAQSIF